MKRQEKRRAEREESKITETLPHRRIPYSNSKRVMTRKEESELIQVIEEQVLPFNMLKKAGVKCIY